MIQLKRRSITQTANAELKNESISIFGAIADNHNKDKTED